MHQSAMLYGQRFFETYCPAAPGPEFTLVEVGSQDVNGSLRQVCPPGLRYIGLDFAQGKGVDVVMTDPYTIPLPDACADMVVTSSCFEHSQFFWLVFLEALRVLKPHGLLYLNAPSNGFFHQWPVDCWRFYPDSGHAMAAWARRNGHPTGLLESFIGQRSAGSVAQGGMWNDFVAVFVKDDTHRDRYRNRILHSLTEFTNGYVSDVEGILNRCERGPDFSLIEEQSERLAAMDLTLASTGQQLAQAEGQTEAVSRQLAESEQRTEALRWQQAESEERIDALHRQLAESEERTDVLHRQLAESELRTESMRRQRDDALYDIEQLKQSSSWRMTAPYRAVRDRLRSARRALQRSDLLNRMVTPPLMLLAYLAYNGSRHGFYKSWRRKSGFMDKMISAQDVVRDRLSERGSLYRQVATLGFALAYRVHDCGSLPRAIRDCGRILWRDGVAGVRRWVQAANPGVARVESAGLAASAGPEAGRAGMAQPGRLLVADYRVPRPDVSAGERATVGILKDLVLLGFDVTFLAKDMVPSPRYEAELRQVGIEVITSESGYGSSAQFVQAQGSRFWAFYFFRVDVAEELLLAARQFAPRARVVFHAPDLYFLREMRAAELQRDAASRNLALHTRARELAVMQQSDHVVVVSPAEVPVLQPELPNTPISVFPALYAPVTASPAGFDRRQDVFFLGGFGHSPNVDAMLWFAHKVWPRVRARLADVRFHIVGAEIPDSVSALGRLPGINVVGFVPDLDPILETMRVAVAPLLYGAGIKGKVAVAMGAGIPCVCTHIAVEGMGIDDGAGALVADEPDLFADAVVSLYTQPATWDRLSRAGQALVRQRFGDAANRSSLIEVLNAARILPLTLYHEYMNRVAPEAIASARDGQDVDVSIIIPAYNHWPLTRACLNSVLQSCRNTSVSFELLLADDGSSDDTMRAADIFPGLRVIRTPSNLGFLRNCNHAADHARGRHLVLLNNDTVVLPGWLDALCRTIEADPSIAIVGSKLLYPDGQIQEAGGGLLANADGVSIGRWMKVDGHIVHGWRDVRHFCIERETDYVSGASLLVRKSFWDSVGGFDQRYQPAYCEDSDLAMAARHRGMRVVYQPASELLHFEHQSYEDAGHLAMMAEHKQLLWSKWRTEFERDHLPPGSDWHLVASHGDRHASLATRKRRLTGRLNVLYFSPFPSHPSNHGNQATIQQFARRFQSMGHRVHFVLLQSHMYRPQDLEAMRDAWDTLDVLPNSHPLGADGQEIPFDGWYEEGLGEHVSVLCARYDIDMVFCSYVFQSKLLEYVPAHILKVIDTHDKMGDRYQMLRENRQPLEFFSCSPEEEGRYLRRADVVVARREQEARYFDSVTGRDSAIVIPHLEDACFIDKGYQAVRKVGIVASANRINLMLVRECLQAIERNLGGRGAPFVVHVAGQVKDMVPSLPSAEAAVFRKAWVRLCGFVPDIRTFYGDMDVIVSPVTMGTGINVKTVQAMAYGMPLVSTAFGVKGIETDDPRHDYRNLDELARGLLEICTMPQELDRLAAVSRRRYQQFVKEGTAAFAALCRHPKLADGQSPQAAMPAVVEDALAV